MLWIEGSIRLPDNMTEDEFQEKWLEFLENNNLAFNGITQTE